MKIRQPFVLLFGGLLSASSIGCSVINAVVTDYRPAALDGRGSAERLVAIGRVFENQGQYDRAEAMYRRAARENPSDPAIREQLQQLAQRREGRSFGTTPTASAIALADAVSTRRSTSHSANISEAGRAAVPMENASPAVSPGNLAGTNENTDTRTGGLQLTSASETASGAIGDNRVMSAFASSPPASTIVRAESDGSERTRVTTEEILAVMDSPADNADLLLAGLKHGDLLETQCLAATLLGDSDPGDERIRVILEQASQTASDPRLLLAICDSRIQRNEADTGTAECLIRLIQQETGAVQIQAISDVRYFAGTGANDQCVAALQSLLDHEAAGIRSMAALTLGSFPDLDEMTSARLNTMAAEDASYEVRNAAKAAISRTAPGDIDETHAIILDPR